MHEQAAATRAEINRLERELGAARSRIRAMERLCSHQWSEPEYTPDIRESFTTPGDPPGTMGIDRQLPCHIPRQETPKWTRTCQSCGTSETTTRTTEKVAKTPAFGR